MTLIGKALWLIETNLAEPVTLNGFADQLAVTPYHLARAFAEATGQPLMRYVWRRRRRWPRRPWPMATQAS